MTSYYDIKYRDVIYSEKEIGRQPIGKRMGMRMDKVCIFDLDGTLTNTLESLTFSVNETLKEMQLPKITSRQCRAFVGNGARVLMEKAITVSGKAHISRLDEAMEIYGRIFDENCTYHVIPYPGILSMLEALSREGIVLAVLSNKPHKQAVHVVEQIFGKERFQIVRGQQEGIPRKPDPTAALRIAEQLHALPEEVVYIGDSEVDVATGRAAGMRTIGVSWGFRKRQVLEEAEAEYIADSPEEILKWIKK